MANLRLRAGNAVRRKMPIIFASGAIIGLGATCYFVARGQMQADNIITERNALLIADKTEGENVSTKLSAREFFDLTWQCYIKAALAAGFTVFCVVGGTYISWKQIASLTASVGLIAANRDKLEAAIKEKYGDEALSEIKKKAAELLKGESDEAGEKVRYVHVTAEETGNGDLLCYEAYSGRWFRSSEEKVIDGENKLNEGIKEYNYAALNDLHTFWGLEWTDFATERGWFNTEYDSNVDEEKGVIFRHSWMVDEKKGEQILVIEIITEPYECYYEY